MLKIGRYAHWYFVAMMTVYLMIEPSWIIFACLLFCVILVVLLELAYARERKRAKAIDAIIRQKAEALDILRAKIKKNETGGDGENKRSKWSRKASN